MVVKYVIRVCMLLILSMGAINAQDSKNDIKKVAAQFVKGADEQNPELVKDVLEENSNQYVLIGGKFSTISASQYIKMLEEKKLGGEPRKITYKHAEYLGENLAVVVLNAASPKYDFLYQISMARSNSGKWEIVGITTEVNEV
ncbi:nuclear transport factor 2 family protein [Flagellimonas myxillae]|uniref:nuclear transport factor 2 family protein n=1 Tax=Flagellimonas myxillae TaxID=2942214 RepID=UPI00201ECC7E|nr:nuclear transport factor 2 family protein [Muricauda myxillae]MCL6264857.1 nuclear transport factor 2 family protein [Muricauda myxillae]